MEQGRGFNYLSESKFKLSLMANNIDRILQDKFYSQVNIIREQGNSVWKNGYLTPDELKSYLESSSISHEGVDLKDRADYYNRRNMIQFEHNANFAVNAYALNLLSSARDIGYEIDAGPYAAEIISGDYSYAQLTEFLAVTRTKVVHPAIDEPLVSYQFETSDGVIDDKFTIIFKGRSIIDVFHELAPHEDHEVINWVETLGEDYGLKISELLMAAVSITDEQLDSSLEDIRQAFTSSDKQPDIERVLLEIRARVQAMKDSVAISAQMDIAAKYPNPDRLDSWLTILADY